MSTLYLDHRGLQLDHVDGRLRIRVPNENKSRFVPLHGLDHVVAAADFALPTGLIGALADRGIALTVIRHRYRPGGVTMLGRPHADVALRLAQYRASTAVDTSLSIARVLVRAKRAAQLRALRGVAQMRPDLRRNTQRARQQLQAVDLQAPVDLDALRGCEGALSRSYYQGLRVALPASLGFARRLRRPPPDPVNATLSLVYVLLGGCAAEAAWRAGLDPMLGFLHAPARGRDSLACDLMEPLRPVADRLVWRLFAERDLRAEDFAHNGPSCLLAKPARARFYQAFNSHAPVWRRTLRGYAMRLRRHLLAQASEGPT